MKNLILLNGPSIADAQISIQKGDRIIAVNRKAKIEEKIGQEINHWFVFCGLEFQGMIAEIYEFLNREGENRLITHSRTLASVKEYLEAKPLPNAHRIILIDEVFAKMNKTALEINPKLKNVESCWNSVAVMLNLLAIADPESSTFIYGMDGAGRESTGDLYFNQEELSTERLPRNKIFADMVFFDKYFWRVMKKQGLAPLIFNMNLSSFYDSFPLLWELKRNRKFNSNSPTFFASHAYTAKELLEKAQQIIQHQNNYLLETILKRVKKKHPISRFINQLRGK